MDQDFVWKLFTSRSSNTHVFDVSLRIYLFLQNLSQPSVPLMKDNIWFINIHAEYKLSWQDVYQTKDIANIIRQILHNKRDSIWTGLTSHREVTVVLGSLTHRSGMWYTLYKHLIVIFAENVMDKFCFFTVSSLQCFSRLRFAAGERPLEELPDSESSREQTPTGWAFAPIALWCQQKQNRSAAMTRQRGRSTWTKTLRIPKIYWKRPPQDHQGDFGAIAVVIFCF